MCVVQVTEVIKWGLTGDPVSIVSKGGFLPELEGYLKVFALVLLII